MRSISGKGCRFPPFDELQGARRKPPAHRRNRKTEEGKNFGVADGTRTHDNWNHNPGLYQLSYSHHWNGCQTATALKLSQAIAGLPGRNRTRNLRLRRPLLYPVELRAGTKNGVADRLWSGWRDSNPRHLAPKASALPGCATPREAEILPADRGAVNACRAFQRNIFKEIRRTALQHFSPARRLRPAQSAVPSSTGGCGPSRRSPAPSPSPVDLPSGDRRRWRCARWRSAKCAADHPCPAAR